MTFLVSDIWAEGEETGDEMLRAANERGEKTVRGRKEQRSKKKKIRRIQREREVEEFDSKKRA